MDAKYKSQAEYAVENFTAIIADLEKHKKRMMSSIHSEQDYYNIPVFAFANYVKSPDRKYTLSYRLSLNVTPGNEISGLEGFELMRKERELCKEG